MESIFIKGARTHNLKNINLEIPRDKIIVITGLSGSGKSSLAFDTLYAEGQRRYVESLSAYARQFLSLMEKPDVDLIEGLSPAISIEQKATSHNPRSTVGTVTEIYDYLRLLFARIGTPKCPDHDEELKAKTVAEICDELYQLEEKTKIMILAPLIRGKKGEHLGIYEELRKEGYIRVKVNGIVYPIDEFPTLDKNKKHDISAVIDRIAIKSSDENRIRLSESIENAIKLTNGLVQIESIDTKNINQLFSSNFSCSQCGYSIAELEPRMFSFNNPFGACPTCGGYGDIMGIDPDLVIPNKGLSVYDDCIAPWRGQKLKKYKQLLVNNAHLFDFPIHRPYYKLTNDEQALVWDGNEHFKGINYFFNKLEKKILFSKPKLSNLSIIVPINPLGRKPAE